MSRGEDDLKFVLEEVAGEKSKNSKRNWHMLRCKCKSVRHHQPARPKNGAFLPTNKRRLLLDGRDSTSFGKDKLIKRRTANTEVGEPDHFFEREIAHATNPNCETQGLQALGLTG
jgi:hypothetical protein